MRNVAISENARYETDGSGECYIFYVRKRPYFFGLIGKKKWIWKISTSDYNEGVQYIYKYI